MEIAVGPFIHSWRDRWAWHCVRGDEIRGLLSTEKGYPGSVEGIGIPSNPIVREMPLAA